MGIAAQVAWDSEPAPLPPPQGVVWDEPAAKDAVEQQAGQPPQNIEGFLAEKAKQYPVAATVANYAKRLVKNATGMSMVPDNTVAGATAGVLHAANEVGQKMGFPAIPRALTIPPKGFQSAVGAWAPRQVEEGTQSATAGVKRLVAPPAPMSPGESVPSAMARDLDERAGALSDTGRGVAQAISPLAIAGAVASPLAAGAALVGGGLADVAANKTASFLGAGPGASKLAGDAAGFVAGGKLANKVAGTDVSKSVQQFMFGDPDPLVMMVRAAKPRSGNTNFKENLAISMPELKSVEPRLGRAVTKIEDLVSQPGEEPALIDIAKRANREVYDHVRGPQVAMQSQIDVTPVGKAMKAVIPKKLYFDNPQRAAQLEAAADKYSGNLPMEDVEAFLKTANAELDAFYDMNPAARRSAVAANPDLAQTDVQAKLFRELIYKKLDEPGGGEAARALQKRYGALLELEDALLRRRNVAMRQQPDNISEQAAKWSGAAQAVKGGVKMFVPGQFKSGLADVAEGVAKPAAASWVKEQQTTDSLIKRAFEKFKGQQENLSLPPDFKPAGLLGPATPAIETPDASYVHGLSATPGQWADVQRKGLPPASSGIGVSGVTVHDILGQAQQAAKAELGGSRLLQAPEPGQPPINMLDTNTKAQLKSNVAPPVAGDLPSKLRMTPMGRMGQSIEISNERKALRNGLLQRFANGRKFEELRPEEQAKLDDFITENLNKPAPVQKPIDMRPWLTGR